MVLDKENKESEGWFAKTKLETPYFSNKISEIFSLLFLGFNIGSVINKGWLGISSDSNPNFVKMWLNIRDISLELKFSDYIGIFKYDTATKKYYFNRIDYSNGTIYYDVKKMYDASSPNENTINTSFDIAFVKIENGKYTLYRDYNYTDEISNGDYTNMESLENMLGTLDTKKYQYVFRKDTCNYDSYCFYEGKWINE